MRIGKAERTLCERRAPRVNHPAADAETVPGTCHSLAGCFRFCPNWEDVSCGDAAALP